MHAGGGRGDGPVDGRQSERGKLIQRMAKGRQDGNHGPEGVKAHEDC